MSESAAIERAQPAAVTNGAGEEPRLESSPAEFVADVDGAKRINDWLASVSARPSPRLSAGLHGGGRFRKVPFHANHGCRSLRILFGGCRLS